MKRIGTNPVMVAYSLYLDYFNSRSYRCVCLSLTTDYNKTVTCASIWKWVQKYHAHIADGFRTSKNDVKKIFVDETLIQINGQDYWLWMIAYDEPNLKTCLMVGTYQEKELSSYVIINFLSN
jgi:transposase-like protein